MRVPYSRTLARGVFAAIPHLAEAAVVQPDQQLTPRVRLGDYRIRAVIELSNETATWRSNLLGYTGRRILFKSSVYLGSWRRFLNSGLLLSSGSPGSRCW